MINRKAKAKRQRIIRWSGISMAVVVILLFLYSLINNTSPLAVINNIWGDVSGNTTDPQKMNKRNLKEYVIKQQIQLDSVTALLESCQANEGKKGVIIVDSPTLNMRSSASLSSNIVMRIPTGTTITVNYFDNEKYYLDGQQGQWYNVSHAGETGWVWGPYIRLSGYELE